MNFKTGATPCGRPDEGQAHGPIPTKQNLNLVDTIAYLDEFEKEKIIYPNMTKYLPFVYDKNDNFFHNDKSFHITGGQISWLVAFLNSSLFKFCFRDNFPELQGGTRELRKVFFELVPVRKVDKRINNAFKKLVDRILAAKAKDPDADTTALEAEIDVMVYKLYELTYKEVLVIDPEFGMSKKEYESFEIK